jgi:hypothetical protein
LAEAGEDAYIAKVAQRTSVSNPDKILEDTKEPTRFVGANKLKSPYNFSNEVLQSHNEGLLVMSYIWSTNSRIPLKNTLVTL